MKKLVLTTICALPMISCVACGGMSVSNARYEKISNHVLENNDPTAHAEVMAIRDACKNINSYDLSDCELYTSCYPCPMCLAAIIWSNIKKVYYGNTKEDAANIGFRDDFIYDFISKLSENKIDNNILELISMDREETIEEFNKFKNKEDKTIY